MIKAEECDRARHADFDLHGVTLSTRFVHNNGRGAEDHVYPIVSWLRLVASSFGPATLPTVR
jgi:hypothetical protein